jgi:hypothetical protein
LTNPLFKTQKKELEIVSKWDDSNGNVWLIVSNRKIDLKDESLENIEIWKMTVYVRHSDEKVF